jgi:hypothetical protein
MIFPHKAQTMTHPPPISAAFLLAGRFVFAFPFDGI